MISASNGSSRSIAIAARPSSAVRKANETPPPKSRRVEPIRPCWISSATWRLSSTTSTRSRRATTRGSRERMRSTSAASVSRADPDTNSMPAHGALDRDRLEEAGEAQDELDLGADRQRAVGGDEGAARGQVLREVADQV